jgi:glutamine transport system permease protein
LPARGAAMMRRPSAPGGKIVEFDWTVIEGALPNLLEGTLMTIKITFWGLFGGFLLGALSGVTRAYGNIVLSVIAQVYVAVIRGTPIVVQVMFIYFALPLLADIRVDAEWAAIVTLIINSGAYISEIVRGALLSVHKGLKEAGQAMGLPFHKILFHIIGPVAFRRMIPPLGNQCIISLKDSSLFIVIGVAELTRQGQEIMASNFRAVEIWSAVAIVYLILTGLMALTLHMVERRMRIL